MPVDLHYICTRGENYHYLGENLFETGNWTATDLLSSFAVGGRLFLHPAKKEPAWYGGTIIRYRSAPSPQEKRKVFVCRREFDYKILCPVIWGQEKAVVRWNEERSVVMSQRDYVKMVRSRLPDDASRPG